MRIKFLAIAALAALAIFAVACGDDDGGSGFENDGDVPTEGRSRGPTATGDGSNTDQEAIRVNIENFAFNPADFTVPTGDSPGVISITNLDSAGHTFTVYTDAEFSEPEGTDVSLSGGANEVVIGNFSAGEYFFRCEIHPSQMQGTFTAE
jgi:plastocyanin